MPDSTIFFLEFYINLNCILYQLYVMQIMEIMRVGKIKFHINYNLVIFKQKLKWRAKSKISKLSNENIHHRPPKKRSVIISQKLDWKAESKIFSEKLNWNKESKIKALSELDLSQLNTHRSSQLLVFHELPKWNELVDSKVKSFENFRYKPSESRREIRRMNMFQILEKELLISLDKQKEI
ncbi:hypothetical protein BpHYR1_030138 [Brachionus plicatilis]|uniref:Uncharacterized protein n=1 Tax=Brachionus plicatilis TaxID=10195 RepID=A0A3M7RMK9_BRAPC|nr:hypothetical protein BpHYR1_030138 [Brachionus plicatilis]